MDEPIDAPEPPSDVPADVVDGVDALNARELRSLVTYVRSRIEYLERPISEFVEPGDDEEILRVEDDELYTVVVKGTRCEDGCDECPHDPHVYVVTLEPDVDGDRRLHWEDLGRLLD